MTDCLDSWAVLRWLEGGEPAASQVERSLITRPLMSWINLGEVSYVLQQVAGAEQARAFVNAMRRRLRLEVPTEARILEAAAIKATHSMAYADAFAVATAVANGARLLTGDPEILEAAEQEWQLLDLRG